jgi:transposase
MVTQAQSEDGIIRLGIRHRRQLEGILSSNGISVRVRVRAQILLLSDEGWDRESIVSAARTSTSTISRVRMQYINEGLDAALSEKPRPGAVPKLNAGQIQSIIAVACTEPPQGFARWSVRLLTEEVHSRGLADPGVSRERIRLILRDHDIKPWREKNVVRAGVE